MNLSKAYRSSTIHCESATDDTTVSSESIYIRHQSRTARRRSFCTGSIETTGRTLWQSWNEKNMWRHPCLSWTQSSACSHVANCECILQAVRKFVLILQHWQRQSRRLSSSTVRRNSSIHRAVEYQTCANKSNTRRSTMGYWRLSRTVVEAKSRDISLSILASALYETERIEKTIFHPFTAHENTFSTEEYEAAGCSIVWIVR